MVCLLSCISIAPCLVPCTAKVKSKAKTTATGSGNADKLKGGVTFEVDEPIMQSQMIKTIEHLSVVMEAMGDYVLKSFERLFSENEPKCQQQKPNEHVEANQTITPCSRPQPLPRPQPQKQQYQQ